MLKSFKLETKKISKGNYIVTTYTRTDTELIEKKYSVKKMLYCDLWEYRTIDNKFVHYTKTLKRAKAQIEKVSLLDIAGKDYQKDVTDNLIIRRFIQDMKKGENIGNQEIFEIPISNKVLINFIRSNIDKFIYKYTEYGIEVRLRRKYNKNKTKIEKVKL